MEILLIYFIGIVLSVILGSIYNIDDFILIMLAFLWPIIFPIITIVLLTILILKKELKTMEILLYTLLTILFIILCTIVFFLG